MGSRLTSARAESTFATSPYSDALPSLCRSFSSTAPDSLPSRSECKGAPLLSVLPFGYLGAGISGGAISTHGTRCPEAVSRQGREAGPACMSGEMPPDEKVSSSRS